MDRLHQSNFFYGSKNMVWIPGIKMSNLTDRQIFLLQYAGYTQVLNFYPAQEKDGDTLRDTVGGNDGNLGAFPDRSGFATSVTDVNNPVRSTDSLRKL